MELTRPQKNELSLYKSKKSTRDVFANWLLNQNPTSRRTYKSILKSFFTFLESQGLKIKEPKEITTKQILIYRDFLSSKGFSNKYQNLHLSVLSSMLQSFVFDQLIEANPCSRVKRPPSDTKKIKHHLTDRELERLLATFTEKQFTLKTLFVVLYSTGQRISSILNLKKQDIQWLDGRMILSLKIKRNKQRLLPVPNSTEVLLKELIKDKKDDEYLFVGRNQVNKPLSVSSFNETLMVKAKKARIKKEISSHTMRRSLLTKLISKGYNLDKIKEGVSFHSDISTLFIYKSSQEMELKDNPILDLEYGSSPERDDWSSPRALIARLEKEFGKFDLDVCASKKNKVCAKFFDKATNGLEQDWSGSFVWCNPPYSQKNEFIEKAHREAQKGTKIVLLMPSFTETKWFAEMKAKSDFLLFLTGRLVFNEQENADTAKFSSVLAFFNIEPREIPDLGWIVSRMP